MYHPKQNLDFCLRTEEHARFIMQNSLSVSCSRDHSSQKKRTGDVDVVFLCLDFDLFVSNVLDMSSLLASTY